MVLRLHAAHKLLNVVVVYGAATVKLDVPPDVNSPFGGV